MLTPCSRGGRRSGLAEEAAAAEEGGLDWRSTHAEVVKNHCGDGNCRLSAGVFFGCGTQHEARAVRLREGQGLGECHRASLSKLLIHQGVRDILDASSKSGHGTYNDTSLYHGGLLCVPGVLRCVPVCCAVCLVGLRCAWRILRFVKTCLGRHGGTDWL